jgi:tRNA (cytosine38-C5)-methyltransferase
MKLRPRYIILENVAGFVGSNMLAKWKVTLGDCGYTWREFLLSPTDVGVPNERRRYYMVCESSLSAPPGTSPPEDGRLVRFIPFQENEIRTSLPALPGSNVMLKTIGDFLLVEKGSDESERLLVPQRLLSAAWAPSRLSICGKNDTRSYCFTKGYGRIFDRSSGSLLFTLGDTGSQLDRTTLSEQHGHLRLFSPEELLLLFGFPPTYTFPDGLSQSQKYAAVGNSISIPVLSAIIASVFSSASPA